MAILVDYSQLAIACAAVLQKNETTVKKDALCEGIVKSVVNTRRLHASKYGKDVTLCCDHGSWRSDVFPEYKWKRRHQASNLDREFINPIIMEVAHDIGDHLGFRVIDVEGAEGDDVIGVLAHHIASGDSSSLFEDSRPGYDRPLIVSADKDMTQLLGIADVFDQRAERLVTGDPDLILKRLIIKGDDSDGIPNILSEDDVFTKGIRQNVVSAKRLQNWLAMPVAQILASDSGIARRWRRNERLISLHGQTPPDIASNIMRSYEAQTCKKPQGVLEYLYSHNLFSALNGAQDLLG